MPPFCKPKQLVRRTTPNSSRTKTGEDAEQAPDKMSRDRSPDSSGIPVKIQVAEDNTCTSPPFPHAKNEQPYQSCLSGLDIGSGVQQGLCLNDSSHSDIETPSFFRSET